jgi:hypothetical protein
MDDTSWTVRNVALSPSSPLSPAKGSDPVQPTRERRKAMNGSRKRRSDERVRRSSHGPVKGDSRPHEGERRPCLVLRSVIGVRKSDGPGGEGS